MKNKNYVATMLGLAVLTACVSENYFNDLNSPPIISTTANLEITDTLKIGKFKNPDKAVYFSLPLLITDINQNLKSLDIEVDSTIVIIDNTGKALPSHYNLNTKEYKDGVNKTFLFAPLETGEYTITATATDQFEISRSLSKSLYVFDNMRPKCVVKEAYYTAPAGTFYEVYVDIRNSFDQDARWGGKIASYKALYHFNWQDDTAEMGTDTLGVFEGVDLPWETIGWVEAWVVDNEGAESEHIHIDLPLKQ